MNKYIGLLAVCLIKTHWVQQINAFPSLQHICNAVFLLHSHLSAALWSQNRFSSSSPGDSAPCNDCITYFLPLKLFDPTVMSVKPVWDDSCWLDVFFLFISLLDAVPWDQQFLKPTIISWSEKAESHRDHILIFDVNISCWLVSAGFHVHHFHSMNESLHLHLHSCLLFYLCWCTAALAVAQKVWRPVAVKCITSKQQHNHINKSSLSQ